MIPYKRGAFGLPMRESKHFPGETACYCPKCERSGTITFTGRHGPGGRLGDPGGLSWAQCEACGYRTDVERA